MSVFQSGLSVLKIVSLDNASLSIGYALVRIHRKHRNSYTDPSFGKLGLQSTGVHLYFLLVYFLSYLFLVHLGLRLADKRSLPCPNRFKWLEVRDELYEEIMNKAWNKEGKFFGQSYEDTSVLDSAVLIMPLVFFMHAVRL